MVEVVVENMKLWKEVVEDNEPLLEGVVEGVESSKVEAVVEGMEPSKVEAGEVMENFALVEVVEVVEVVEHLKMALEVKGYDSKVKEAEVEVEEVEVEVEGVVKLMGELV